MVQVLGGPAGGFTIDLNANVDDYIPSTKTKGFMVYFRSPNETVLINEGGILVSPGTETFIGLSKNKVQRLPPKYGACENVPSPFIPTIPRSVRECIQEENLILTVQNCHCVPWYLRDKLMKLNNTDYMNYWYNLKKVKDDEEVNQEEVCGFATQTLCEVQVLEKLVKMIGNQTKCPEPCSFEDYDWSVNKGDFPPTEAYYDLLLKNQVTIEDQKDKTYDFARENYVRIHIFYPDIKVTEKEQEKAYEIFNFIAEFGGTVDMMISFSFFTVFQVLEMVIVWVCYKNVVARKITGSDVSSEGIVGQLEDIVIGEGANGTSQADTKSESDRDKSGVFSTISGVFT